MEINSVCEVGTPLKRRPVVRPAGRPAVALYNHTYLSLHRCTAEREPERNSSWARAHWHCWLSLLSAYSPHHTVLQHRRRLYTIEWAPGPAGPPHTPTTCAGHNIPSIVYLSLRKVTYPHTAVQLARTNCPLCFVNWCASRICDCGWTKWVCDWSGQNMSTEYGRIGTEISSNCSRVCM
jgi:hypothetical protein